MITRPTLPDYNAAGGAVLWLCGPTGVGKSAVGFQIFMRQLGTGSATAFVDLDQVGFIAPAVIDESIKHQLKAANLAAVWSNYAASGATHLVVVGPAGSRSDLDEYIDALPGATVTVARLHADPEELTRRIMLRSKGQGWAQPGDPILGQSADRLSDIIEAAIADTSLRRPRTSATPQLTPHHRRLKTPPKLFCCKLDGQVPPRLATRSRFRNDGVNGREPAVRLLLDPPANIIGVDGLALMRALPATHSQPRIGMWHSLGRPCSGARWSLQLLW